MHSFCSRAQTNAQDANTHDLLDEARILWDIRHLGRVPQTFVSCRIALRKSHRAVITSLGQLSSGIKNYLGALAPRETVWSNWSVLWEGYIRHTHTLDWVSCQKCYTIKFQLLWFMLHVHYNSNPLWLMWLHIWTSQSGAYWLPSNCRHYMLEDFYRDLLKSYGAAQSTALISLKRILILALQ